METDPRSILVEHLAYLLNWCMKRSRELDGKIEAELLFSKVAEKVLRVKGTVSIRGEQSSIPNDSPTRAWITGLAKHALLDALRSKRRRDKRAVLVIGQKHIAKPESDVLSLDELKSQVINAVDNLGDYQMAAVIIGRYLVNLNDKEISEKCDIKYDRVRHVAALGKKKLKHMIESAPVVVEKIHSSYYMVVDSDGSVRGISDLNPQHKSMGRPETVNGHLIQSYFAPCSEYYMRQAIRDVALMNEKTVRLLVQANTGDRFVCLVSSPRTGSSLSQSMQILTETFLADPTTANTSQSEGKRRLLSAFDDEFAGAVVIFRQFCNGSAPPVRNRCPIQ